MQLQQTKNQINQCKGVFYHSPYIRMSHKEEVSQKLLTPHQSKMPEFTDPPMPDTPQMINKMTPDLEQSQIIDDNDFKFCFDCCWLYALASEKVHAADKMVEIGNNIQMKTFSFPHDKKHHTYYYFEQPFWYKDEIELKSGHKKKELQIPIELRKQTFGGQLWLTHFDRCMFDTTCCCIIPTCCFIYSQNIKINYYERFVHGIEPKSYDELYYEKCCTHTCIASFVCPAAVAKANHEATYLWDKRMFWHEKTNGSSECEFYPDSNDGGKGNFLSRVFDKTRKVAEEMASSE